MIILILLCISISILVGGITWTTSREVTWQEWAIAPIVAIITGFLIYNGLTYLVCSDIQTLSGYVSNAVYIPKWVSETSSTDSKGRRTTRTETHYPEWKIVCRLGDKKSEEVSIQESEYSDLKNKFGGKTDRVLGSRPNYDSGDRYDYYLVNTKLYQQPVNIPKTYINHLKNNNTLFSYSKVTQKLPYPYPSNIFQSNRLMGVAKSDFNILEFDRMNARLGILKKVNVILFGFNSPDMNKGQLVESSWNGGQKNDLVICYGKGWAHCFGWTEADLVKRNLETLFITTTPNTAILPSIEKIIKENYVLKDWSKFNYVGVNFPLWSYFVTMMLNLLIQSFYFYYITHNVYKKDTSQ